MSDHPQPPARDPARFTPLFILATARSYSSVVATMIGQHPNLAGLPELKLFCYPTIAELEAALPRYWIDRGVTHRSPGLVRALAEFEFGGQTIASLGAARVWLQERRHWSGADILDVLLARLSPRQAVEKSPDNLLTDDALARMAEAYPRARYLHLARHPVTTQQSMQAHLKRTVPSYPQDGEPMSGIGSWYEIHRRILNLAANLSADRYLLVRAEDVLNNTESQLHAIASWLGLRTDTAAIEAMRHPEASAFACSAAAESGVAGGNDPGFLGDPVPHRIQTPGKLEAPQGWVADQGIWDMVADMANRLGYF